MSTYTRIVLASRPAAEPALHNFRLETAPMPVPESGQLLVRTLYLSLDPYMRGRMSAARSYAPPTAIGETMPGEAVAEVIESRHPDHSPGELVRALIGWRTHAAISAADARPVSPGSLPVTTCLGVLGMPGFTAYAGLKVIGRPKAGETLVVSAAAGPVGSLVGQLAKLAGARAVGIAGGASKSRYLIDTLGLDAAVDRRAEDFPQALQRACPQGIDIYFENAGGAVWQAVLPLLNRYARVPVCGLIALYSGARHSTEAQQSMGDGLSETMLSILRRSLLVRGFINTEFVAEYYRQFLEEVGPLVASGRIRYHEQVVEGLEAAPRAFIGMLEGRNFGKLIIKVAPDATSPA
jgi:NADPH-dependent curcumin reductase